MSENARTGAGVRSLMNSPGVDALVLNSREETRMRLLVLSLAAAASLACAVPANAQTVYINDGYRGGSGYGYWGGGPGPRSEIVVGAPRARVYVDEDGPRYRRAYRGGYAYDGGYDAYAYSGYPDRGYAYGGYPYRGYRSWGGPGFAVGWGW
jgi:hypothetical protein